MPGQSLAPQLFGPGSIEGEVLIYPIQSKANLLIHSEEGAVKVHIKVKAVYG